MLTRISARATPMPDGEDLATLRRSGATLVLHLAVQRIEEVVAAVSDVLRRRSARSRWSRAPAGTTR